MRWQGPSIVCMSVIVWMAGPTDLFGAEFEVTDQLTVDGPVVMKSSAAFKARSAPALTQAGEGAVYFDATGNRLKYSENGGPWKDLSAVVAIQDSLQAGATFYVSSGTVSGSLRVGSPASGAAALQVRGQVAADAYNAGSSTTIDWNNGNVQYTAANCGAMSFSNMADGGAYTLVVTGATAGTCSFTHAGLTFRAAPAVVATTAATHSVFTFLRAGTNVYIGWIMGL